MELKAYGATASLENEILIITAHNAVSRGAMDGETQRIIPIKDITYLELSKGNLFVNHRIIVGEEDGITNIAIVPWPGNYAKAETFFNALYNEVNTDHDITENKKPKGYRKRRY